MTTAGLIQRWLIGAFAGLLFGGVGFWFAASAAGLGHGTYLPAAILFPYTMIGSVIVGSISPVLIGLALLQYSLYGGISAQRPGSWRAVSWLHAAAALVAVVLILRSDVFR